MSDDYLPDPVPPFTVGVVAPFALDAPGLADTLDRLLVRLTERRRRHNRQVALLTVMNEPVATAAGEVCRRHGWFEQWRAPDPDVKREWAVVRECVGIAAAADALVILGGDRPGELATRLAWLCEWLGTPYRVVRV